MIPQIQITNTGYVAPTREEITAGLWELMSSAFGGDITQDDRTPQGQLVTSLTAALYDKDSQFIVMANNFDPRYSSGKFQEALGAVYFLDRAKASSSVAILEFTGLSGADIPVGTQAQDGNGSLWETTQAVTVGVGGKATVEAKCLVTGPVTAAPLTINQLISTIAGVDQVTNRAPAIMGRAQESRSDYEGRRYDSVAANAKGTAQSVYGAVSRLNGVIDCKAVSNFTGSATQVGATNYPMIRNSLLVSVAGGEDLEIAREILVKGGTGCSFVGNTTVNYLDTESWPEDPPSYAVKFLRPDSVPLYFNIQVAALAGVRQHQIDQAKESILQALNTGANRARIGGRVVAASYVCSLDGNLVLVKIQVSRNGTNWLDYIDFGVDEIPASAPEMITVTE